MAKISLAFLCLYIGFIGQTRAQACIADTTYNDIVFLIDNSGSIQPPEYGLFENLIVSSINKVQAKCAGSQVGVVHYGGEFGAETAIEHPLSNSTVINSVQRQFCQSASCNDGGDDLNNAIGDLIGFIEIGALNRDPNNKLSIVIFTDAFPGLSCDGPNPFPNCSQIAPYTAIDILKAPPYNAQVTVVAAEAQAEAAFNQLGIYASPGGNYSSINLDADCATSFDGCTLPRKFIPVEFNSPVAATSDSIVACVECQLDILTTLAITAGDDQTICLDLNESAELIAMPIAGTPISYEWDNLLGFGNAKTVMPLVTTTFSVTATDANGCTSTDQVTVTVEDMCLPPCDPNIGLSIAGPTSFCENFGESASFTANMTVATDPVIYTWDNGLGTGASQTVSPTVTTTYTVTAVDANDCTLTESITIQPQTCEACDAFAGRPLEFEEYCLVSGTASISTARNEGIVLPSGYEIIYILTDQNLTIINYRIGSGSFSVTGEGVYRVHTLIAEVTNRGSEDYLDLSIIRNGQSTLFVIANCISDHGICADFDFAGRVNMVYGPDNMMCMQVENSINLCSDGRDNDGDGLVDCVDPDCKSLTTCLESSLLACNDLFDNDEDGLVDCYDPDCWEFIRCYEKEEKCNDGIDNDGDGLVDCDDESCFGSASCKENSPFTCVDGKDNDRDGLIDCRDPQCQRFIVCAEFDVAACTDGLDNDYDGLVDCADSDCQFLLSTVCAPEESTFALCSDGIDNDGDGLLDCADADCGFIALAALENQLSSLTTLTGASCPFNDDGSIIFTGGLLNTSYQYSLNGATPKADPSFTGLIPGEYEITISTITQCVLSYTVTITESDCTEICDDGIDNDGDGLTDCQDGDCGITGFPGQIAHTDPECPALSNGSISITGQGSLTYTYSINAGADFQNSPVFMNLSPGSYLVIILAESGCTYSEQVVLANNNCIEICNDGMDNDGDGLTDCADPDCGITGIQNNIVVTDATCPDLNNASIRVNGQTNGVAYTYSINGGAIFQESNVFDGLSADNYQVLIRTSNGCDFLVNVDVGEETCSEDCTNGLDDDMDGLVDCDDPDCGVQSFDGAILVTNDDCDPEDNGFIEISGQIDGVNYSYSIDGGDNFETFREFENLSAGTYNVVIRTEGACSYSEEIIISKPDCPESCADGIDNDGDGLVDCADPDCGLSGFSDAILVTNVNCDDPMSGSIEITGQMDGFVYTYSINGGSNFQAASLFSGLTVGSYPVIVRTNGGCDFSISIDLVEPNCSEICDNNIDDDGDGLVDCADPDCGFSDNEISVATINPTCANDNLDGLIRIENNGQSGLMYSIDGGDSFQTESVFGDLVVENDTMTYGIIVRKTSGCDFTTQVILIKEQCPDPVEVCDNNIDDDGDGLVDCADPDCGVAQDDLTIETNDATCANNNLDGLIRIVSAGQTGLEYSIDGGDSFQMDATFGDLVIDTDSILFNVVVRNASGCDFMTPVALFREQCPEPNQIEICDDGIDNDGDQLIDCDDPDCAISSEEISITTGNPTCANNNQDGLIRIESDRAGLSYSIDSGDSFQSESTFGDLVVTDDTTVYTVVVRTGSGTGCEFRSQIELIKEVCTSGDQAEICDNNIDDDGDGLIDCADPDCGIGDIVAPVILSATCPDNDNGTIIYDGPSENILFSLDNVEYQELALFENIAAGRYTLYLQNASGCIDSIDIAVGSQDCSSDSTTTSGFFSSVSIDVTAVLQGAYDAESQEMTTHLNDLGYLPGQKPATFFGKASPAGQPFNQAPWFYSGTEGVFSKDENKSNAEELYTTDVVDWLLVCLRTEMDKSSTIWQGAALLHSDGYVELINAPALDIAVYSEYYIVIEHRNHLPVMTPYKVPVIDGQLRYDFTRQDSYKSVIGVGQVQLEDGTYALLAGNGELNTEISSQIDINVRDFNSWLQENGSNSSYFIEDYDLNGDINIKDRILWENNNGLFSTMPNR